MRPALFDAVLAFGFALVVGVAVAALVEGWTNARKPRVLPTMGQAG